jgi:hypothetical protein
MNLIEKFGVAFEVSGTDAIADAMKEINEINKEALDLIQEFQEANDYRDLTDEEFKALKKLAEQRVKARRAAKEQGKEQKKSSKAFLKTGLTLLALGAAAKFAFTKMTSLGQIGEGLLNLSYLAATSAESFQLLANTAKRFGGNAQGTANTIKGLNEQLLNIWQYGGESTGIFKANMLYGLKY